MPYTVSGRTRISDDSRIFFRLFSAKKNRRTKRISLSIFIMFIDIGIVRSRVHAVDTFSNFLSSTTEHMTHTWCAPRGTLLCAHLSARAPTKRTTSADIRRRPSNERETPQQKSFSEAKMYTLCGEADVAEKNKE